MLEALCGLGYSTATVLADIIDNSLSAGAGRVDVAFDWAGAASTVRVLDDGSGMDAAGLDTAMRLGEISPLAARSSGTWGGSGLASRPHPSPNAASSRSPAAARG